jgi:hypothetical protein
MVVAAYSDEDRRREVEHFLAMPKTRGWRSSGGKMGWRARPHREHFGFRDRTSQPGDPGPDRTVGRNKPDEGERA